MGDFSRSVVIIPTYNESDNINRMIETLFRLYPELSILIIDDHSPDGTAQQVKELQKQYPQNLHLIQRVGKLGLGTAYVTGFKWALDHGFDLIFQMDCDFSHDPHDLKNLLKGLESADLVIGSRYIDGIRVMNWPMHRLLLSYFASIYTRIITGLKAFDTTGGFKGIKRQVLESLDLDRIFSNGYSFQIEVNFKTFCKGFRLKEVPIVFHERRDGQSKMNWSIVREAIFAVFFLRFKKIFGQL